MAIEIEVTQRKPNMTLFSSHGQVILSNGVVDVIALPEQISRLINEGAITKLYDLSGNIIDWSDKTIKTLEFTSQWRPIKETFATYSNCEVMFRSPITGRIQNEKTLMITAQTIWRFPNKPLLLFYGESFIYLSANAMNGLKLINPYMEFTKLIPED